MNFNLNEFVITELFAYSLIFCRLGSAFMAVPGIGDAFVPVRARLLFALTMTFLLTPVLRQYLPKTLPTDVFTTFALVGSEIIYGIFLGILARIVVSTVHTAGMVIATNAGLSAAMLFDPNQGSQGTAVGNLLGIIAITLILSTDLHHYIFYAITHSYIAFTPGDFSPMVDFGPYLVKLAAKSFLVAMQIAAPITVITVVIYFTGGILSRLMPAIQIFFIMMPLQIILSFLIMFASVSGIVLVFMNHFENTFSGGISTTPF